MEATIKTKPIWPTIAQLVAGFAAAVDAAHVAYANPEDGGSCNFDSAVLLMPRRYARRIETAAAQVPGISVDARRWRGGCFFVSVDGCQCGQAARVTRTAKAVEKAMADAGLPTTMYYQLD